MHLILTSLCPTEIHGQELLLVNSGNKLIQNTADEAQVNTALKSQCVNIVKTRLDYVSLQHGFLDQNASEAEVAQVQCFKVSVQDQFCNAPTHCRRVLQAMATETSGKVHVVDHGVHTNDTILVKGVVVIETCPCAGNLHKNKDKKQNKTGL